MGKFRNEELFENKTTVRQAVQRALYMGSAAALAGSLALAGTAVAQDDVDVDEDEQLEEITVTGSRLSRSGFDSATPMDVVNVQDSISLGYTDLSDMLISTPALAGSDQMTDVLSGILSNVNGGQGVQTLDLRGLGAGRTLSLINGRRAGPAGVRDGVTSFDLNVIPVSGLERVEILKDGASSIYGSDAIGGVVNYITRKGDGGEFNAYTQMAEESGGEIMQINASYGRESEKGYWRVTVDYNKQEQILKGDREIFDCQQEYTFNEPSLQTRADVIDPRTGRYKCEGFHAGSMWIYDYHDESRQGTNATPGWNYEYVPYLYVPAGNNLESNVTRISTRAVYDYDGFLAASGLLPDPNNGADDPADLRVPEGWYILPQGALGWSLTPLSGDLTDKEVMVPERDRVTLMASGEYNISDSMTLYAEGLFNRRESFHRGGATDYWTYNYTSDYQYIGYTYDYYYDYTTYEYVYYNYQYHWGAGGDPESAGWTGAQLLDPIIAVPTSGARTEVDYARFVLGAKGDLGDSNWSYDASFQYSKSDGEYDDFVRYADARFASANRAPYWYGDHIGLCEGTSFTRYGPLDSQGVPTVRDANIPCVDVNFLDPRVLAGDFTDEEYDFLFGLETGSTKYTNESFDVGFVNNELFSMPAGALGVAAGLQFMTDEIADTPGIESRSGNNWDGGTGEGPFSEYNIGGQDVSWVYKAARVFGTYGQTKTQAAYLETAIPLLANKPVAEYLELSASARYTKVSIDATEETAARDFTGDTYKVGFNWMINDSIRVRANRGTSFRTPALFELYRKNFRDSATQSSTDPCFEWGAAVAANTIPQSVADNCRDEGIPDDISSLIPMDIVSGGGAAHLDPETSQSNTIGIVFTAQDIDFRMSVDYWDLEVRDRIGINDAFEIVQGCYYSDTYPNDLLCDLIEREDPNLPVEGWRITNVEGSYVNLDVQRAAGWDIEATYTTTLPNDWDLSVNTSHTISTTKETESTEGIITSRKGWAGNPQWVGNLTVRLSNGPWSAAWRTNYIDGTDNNRPGIDTSDSWIGLSGLPETYYYSRTLNSRFYHNASFNYEFGEGWQANLSITNIADELPPRASPGAGINVQGYGAFHSQYDWKGRRYGLNIKKTF